MFLRLVVVGILAGLVGRLAWVQVVTADEIIRRGEERRLMTQELAPMRGAIRDRNGRTLAVSVPVNAVVANPMQIKDPGAVAAALAPHLNMTAEQIQKILLDHAGSGYAPLKKRLTQSEAKQIEKLRIEGISVVPDSVREYPQGSAANQVVGYLDPTGTQGEYGLEARYDKELRGQPGYVRAEFTRSNIPIEETIREMVPSVQGYDLILTIDVALQQLVEARLDEVIKKQNAKRALVIAMDAHTGEVLTMAMRPGAHPGDRRTWLNSDGSVDFGRINNWAVSPMPPGSIFKTITTAAALEERAITLETTFVDRGFMTISGWTIRNWDQVVKPEPKPMNVAELMQVSSNIGLIQVGQRLPKDAFVKYLDGFGFMGTTGLDFSHESKANLGSAFDNKTDVDWANMYIGQHLEVTPIQMITAVAAIANGGYLVQPHLVREIRDDQGQVVRAMPAGQRRQVLSQATAKEVQQIMVSVVETGTGSTARVPGYTVGGKTGTAQKFEEGKIKDRHLADFVGFAPAANPQIVMLVMIDEPDPPGFGGLVAAPLFSELMPHVMRAVGIAPNTDAAKGQAVPPKVTTGRVPDLVGLPASWARERLTLAGFVPKLTGPGPVVTAQSLLPGSVEKAGATVELTLAPRDEKQRDQVLVPDFAGLSIAEASQLASDIGMNVKAGGSGFVVDQEPKPGSVVPVRSTLTVRLAPPAR